MTNKDLFTNWLLNHQIHLAPLLKTSDGEFFRWHHQLCLLPYLRAYWKHENGDAPDWQTNTWGRLGNGWTRFLSADQVMDWLAFVSEKPEAVERLQKSTWRALLSAWLVQVDEFALNCEPIVTRRVEAVRVDLKDRRLFWRRRPKLFPEQMRYVVEGLDPVHTPENEHAGLTRYLCDGWSISADGNLQASPGASSWGPCTGQIPYRLFDAPRRLMLGASLQTRAVQLMKDERPSNPKAWKASGLELRSTFSCFNGWTHEDAIVLSQSAADKLRQLEVRHIQVSIPAVASRIELLVEEGAEVQRGDKLVRAFIDLYGLGWRLHEVASLGAVDGWLEIALLSSEAPVTGKITAITRNAEAWDDRRVHRAKWRETITFSLKRQPEVQVGDKLSTRHGFKGVVSRILPDLNMPQMADVRADLVLSPIGIARRSAMGQFREANSSETLPRGGAIFVMRQPQDAEPRCRVRGPDQISTTRGQRFGEMEFWALMAYNARKVAQELLSPERSTGYWMQWEKKIDSKGTHRTLATRALNRFLSLIQVKIKDGRFIRETEPESFTVASEKISDFRNARDLLEDSRRFSDQGGLGALRLQRPVQLRLENETYELETVYLLPPWLRPAVDGHPHPLTKAYLSLFYAMFSRKDLRQPIRRCIRIALDHKNGAGGFLRREILGRRMKRSARAVIVPRPNLRIDQILIPHHVASSLFQGLPEQNSQLVLVNRNPTLHQRGLVALRPLIDDSNSFVFGLPPGVLKVLGADFDGDQASIFALENLEALDDARRMLPGSGSRFDCFRPTTPAFPLSRELSVPEDELQLSQDNEATQEAWCDKHKKLVDRQLEAIGDGWTSELLKRLLDENGNYLAGLREDDWLKYAQSEMEKVYLSVRKKAQLGGIIRQQLYRRAYAGDEQFSASVAAVQVITERLTQSALSVKGGSGVANFDVQAFFRDPVANQQRLSSLDPYLDMEFVTSSLGEAAEPTGLLAWMARPRLDVLLKVTNRIESEEPRNSAGNSDPRISWFLS